MIATAMTDTVAIPTRIIRCDVDTISGHDDLLTMVVAVSASPLCRSNTDDDEGRLTNPKKEDAATFANEVCIHLTPDEDQLFAILLAVATQYNGTTTTASAERVDERLTVRVAGGWVRDKILESQTLLSAAAREEKYASDSIDDDDNASNKRKKPPVSIGDIDVAINLISGVEFATMVQSYIREQQTATGTTEQQHVSCGSLGIIAANPDQSKHLETATMRIGIFDIDFSPLRGQEVYTTDSRIPTTQAGTPCEDAYRRDFTCNALFYNLSTQQMEDWTQRGYDDLRHSRLVTPLDPYTTILDDPLRILRAIRFAVRCNFTMDAKLIEAAQHPDIHTALSQKVSRERVGKELEGMLSGKMAQPVPALSTIADLNLSSSVFSLPTVGVHCSTLVETIKTDPRSFEANDGSESEAQPPPNQDMDRRQQLAWDESRRLLRLVHPVWDGHQKATRTGALTSTKPDFRLLALTTYLLPFRNWIGTDLPKTNNPNATCKEWSAVTFIVKESIKFRNVDVVAVTTLVNLVDSVVDFLSNVVLEAHRHHPVHERHLTVRRLESGLWVRQAKELWVTLLLLATILLLRKDKSKRESEAGLTGNGENDEVHDSNQTDWTHVCNEVYAQIVDLQLDNCWKVRPLLDGKSMIKALGIPQGPTVGLYMEEQVRWMLQNPQGTTEECIRHLQQSVVLPHTESAPRKRGNDDINQS